MLSDADREIVTAAVDGELPPSAGPRFRALMAGSAEAFALYQALTADARRLAALPRHPAPAGLPADVWAGIAAMPVVVPVVPAAPPRRRRSSRLVPAVAASVAALAALGTLLAPRGDRAVGPVVAEVKSRPVPPALPQPDVPGLDPDPFEPFPAPVRVAVAEPAPAPRPAADPDVVGGVSLVPLPVFATLAVRGPALFAVTDLDRPDVQQRLAADLGHDPAHRIDLFARDPVRGFDAVRAAAESAGVKLTIDAGLTERFKRKLPTAWAVYTESLPPDDIRRLLGSLAGPARGGDSAPLVTLHLVPAGPADARDFRELTGVDRALWKRQRPASGVAGGTADQVAGAVQKSAKTALAVPVFPAGGRPNPLLSPDVKAFWQQAGPVRGVSTAVLIVCRESEASTAPAPLSAWKKLG